MDQFEKMPDILMSTLQNFINKVVDALPALLLLIVGWLAAKLIAYIFTKVLTLAKFDTLAERIKADDMLQKANITAKPSQLVGKFVYYMVLLLFFIMATESLGWTIVSEQFSKLIDLIPTLLIGIVIFVLGVYVATFFRDFIAAATSSLGLSTGRLISNFVFYFLMVIVTLTALDQIGINTDVITSKVDMMVGAVLVTGAISYGFASRDILSNMLGSFFSRKTFEVGQVIRIGDVEGKIIKIESICITIQTAKDKVVVPAKELVNERIHILIDTPER